MTAPAHNAIRFLVPPSLGSVQAARGSHLERYLSRATGKLVEVNTASSYETLARDLLAGKAEAGWAPPFVCARLEAMGVRIVTRGLRNGASTYRATLVCRADAGLTEQTLQGTSAAWVDRESVGGYLLALAHLRAAGLDPAMVFFSQQFLGSYQAALEAVLEGRADVTSVFAPDPAAPLGGIAQILPGKVARFCAIASTDAVPNDGVAVAVGIQPQVAEHLERVLLAMHDTPDGQRALKEAFNLERFEAAPRLGYRALYRVALASL